ncbi:MAG: hypothetical protein J07HQW1_03329 [Haloquadratum walsbyi J07HQW1]|jgi:hypothetical protein|uniref:Uncharacterized protein n=1 Tax=Haloquadratum walsbyi J07HQW1 TaxID=1238424 RepID=U1N9N1_9EURY|nr:MAG: hypothetical protein J07HQW1_03329 [Haloquadratum walsbyi J07HQW1]
MSPVQTQSALVCAVTHKLRDTGDDTVETASLTANG